MQKLENLCSQFKSEYQAAKNFNVHQQQLQRWIKNGAYVDSDGSVYIKTKGVVKND